MCSRIFSPKTRKHSRFFFHLDVSSSILGPEWFLTFGQWCGCCCFLLWFYNASSVFSGHAYTMITLTHIYIHTNIHKRTFFQNLNAMFWPFSIILKLKCRNMHINSYDFAHIHYGVTQYNWDFITLMFIYVYLVHLMDLFRGWLRKKRRRIFFLL